MWVWGFVTMGNSLVTIEFGLETVFLYPGDVNESKGFGNVHHSFAHMPLIVL